MLSVLTSSNCFLDFVVVPDFLKRSDRLSSLACQFDKSLYRDECYKQYSIEMPESLSEAVPKRRAEYLAGRFLASQLLKDKGVHAQLGIGKHRCPVWPQGVVGSITHTDTLAFCVLAKTSDLYGVGIDAEPVMLQNVIDTVKQNVIDVTESRIISASDLELRLAFTLVYSAKESLFKALYPTVMAYFDFDAARLLEFNVPRQQLLLQLTHPLHERFPVGTIFSVDWALVNETVVTLLEIPNSAPCA